MSACAQCQVHGVFSCQETVGTCGQCGTNGDVFVYRAGPSPEVVCLDCITAGKHMTTAHQRDHADVETVEALAARPAESGGFAVRWEAVA